MILTVSDPVSAVVYSSALFFNFKPEFMNKIAPDAIEFLAFEGGGGRGAAYLGSFIAFLHPAFQNRVFRYDEARGGYVLNNDVIKGVAGTSAGSIASILLASKVSLETIMDLLIKGGNNRIEDAPSLIAMLKKKKKKKGGQKQNFLESFNNNDLDTEYALCPSVASPSGFTRVKRNARERKQAIYDFYDRLGISIDSAWMANGIGMTIAVLEKMLASLNILDNITSDFGVVHGYTLRNYVDYLVSKAMELELQANPSLQKQFERRPQRVAPVTPKPVVPPEKWSQTLMNRPEMPVIVQRDVLKPQAVVIPDVNKANNWYSFTFGEHYQIFGTELVICSTHVERGQPTYFSYKYTPNVRIADALRMSLSIPGFFKAFKITTEDINKSIFSSGLRYTGYEQALLPGTWVDGGVKNNLPIRAFDIDKEGQRIAHYKHGDINPGLLGMALGRASSHPLYPDLLQPSNDTKDILDYILSLFDTIVANSSELQFHNEEEHKRVLDITTALSKEMALSTYNFDPEPKVMATIVNNAINETLEYFGISQAESPVNNIDSGLYKESVKEYLNFIKINAAA